MTNLFLINFSSIDYSRKNLVFILLIWLNVFHFLFSLCLLLHFSNFLVFTKQAQLRLSYSWLAALCYIYQSKIIIFFYCITIQNVFCFNILVVVFFFFLFWRVFGWLHMTAKIKSVDQINLVFKELVSVNQMTYVSLLFFFFL